MLNLLICYLSIFVISTISGEKQKNPNRNRQIAPKRSKYKVEIELKDDSSDSLVSNFNQNVDEFVDFIERDNLIETIPLADVIQLETADVKEKVSPPAFKEVKKDFKEVFDEFLQSLENEKTIKNETIILEDSSSSVELMEVDNRSKKQKIRETMHFGKEIITLEDSSDSVEIIQDNIDNIPLLTSETHEAKQNFIECSIMSQKVMNEIQRAIHKQTFENAKELCNQSQINNPIESYYDQFLQTDNELYSQEQTTNKQDVTMLETQNLCSRDVQEQKFSKDFGFSQELIKNNFVGFFCKYTENKDHENNSQMTFENSNNNWTQEQQNLFRGYNAQNNFYDKPDNESIDEKLREIRQLLDQDFDEDVNQDHGGFDNRQVNQNNEPVCENIDENVRKIRELLDQITNDEMDQQQDISIEDMQEKAFNDALDMAEEMFLNT